MKEKWKKTGLGGRWIAWCNLLLQNSIGNASGRPTYVICLRNLVYYWHVFSSTQRSSATKWHQQWISIWNEMKKRKTKNLIILPLYSWSFGCIHSVTPIEFRCVTPARQLASQPNWMQVDACILKPWYMYDCWLDVGCWCTLQQTDNVEPHAREHRRKNLL